MTTMELQLKTSRFTAKMNRREMSRVIEFIEDIMDGRDVDLIRKRKEELIPHEKVKALAGL